MPLPFEEAKKLARSFMLQKRIGQLAEGKNAWMRLVDDDGKLRHTINPNGTVTGRASHFGPNLGQVPATRAPYGGECRQLFQPAPGYTLVGADLSGLELRCLAGFLHQIDGGAYAKVVWKATSPDERRHGRDRQPSANHDLRTLLRWRHPPWANPWIRATGRKGTAATLLQGEPRLRDFGRRVKNTAKNRGYLLGLDKRQLPIRSDHAALNVLLQSAGALLSKKWVELIDAELTKQNLDARIIAWVHDEVQIETKGDPEHVGRITRRMAEEAGRAFSFAVPIEADFSVGTNWAGTH